MYRLQSKKFSKWASDNGLSNDDLNNAINEISQGLCEATLGGHLYKKRIATNGKGKRGGARTIVCYKKGDRAIFLHGFAKNETDNISKKELEAFRELAKNLINLSQDQILTAVKNGTFKEIDK
jgi:hypothetical protein